MLVFFWCGCNCNQNIPNFFEERKAQMEDWSVQLKSDVFVERFVILEHGMVNSEGYLLFSFLTHSDDSCSYRRKVFYAYVHSFRLLNNYHSYQSVVCRFHQEKKPANDCGNTFFKIHTYFQAKKQTKIDPANTNLCSIPMSLISCRKLHVWSVSYLAIHKRWKSETM